MNEAKSTLGELRVPRGGHTATLLLDGCVLLSGGGNPAAIGDEEQRTFNDVDLVDPVGGTIVAGPALSEPCEGHHAALLPDGRAVVVGGLCHRDFLDDVAQVEIWNPAVAAWAPGAPVPSPKLGSRLVTLAPRESVLGHLMLTGGLGRTTSNECAIWNANTDRWRQTGGLKTSRYLHGLCTLKDGSVLAVGGFHLPKMDQQLEATASIELWSPESERWSQVGKLPIPTAEPTVTALPNGGALVAGGYGCEDSSAAFVWDANTKTLSPTGDLNVGRAGHTTTVLSDGSALVIGGASAFGDGLTIPIDEAERWNPATGEWTVIPGFVVPRFAHTATLLQDGRVLVAGGWNRGAPIGTVEVWTPTS